MAKSHDRIKARLIPSEKQSQQRMMSTRVRPFRLAFVIHEGVTQEQLLMLLEYNSLVWGGYFNLMIPTNGRMIRDDWFTSLINHDPDIIMIVGELDVLLIEKISKYIQPYHIWQWDDDILNTHLKGEETIGSLSTSHILTHIYNSNRQISNSRIRIPQITSHSSLHLYAIAQHGKLPQEYENYCINQLRGQHVKLPNRNLKSYLSSIVELDDKLTPIRMTKIQLSTNSGFGGKGFTIVLSGSNFLSDLCLFWNLRTQPFFQREDTIFLPASSIRSMRGLTHLAEYCNQFIRGTNYIVLASDSLNKGQLLRIREKILPLLDTKNIEFIDIWFANFITGDFHVHEQEQREEVKIEEKFFRLKNIQPDIESRLGDSSWVVDVQLVAEGRQPIGFLPPKFSDLNQLLANNPDPWMVKASRGYRSRLANGYLSYRVSRKTEFIGGFMPSDQQVFQALLRSQGYSSLLSDKCRYAQGIMRLLGGIKGAAIFRDIKLGELFQDMAKGTGHTPRNMLSLFKPGSNQQEIARISDLITDLSLKKIFLRGYTIHCPACDLKRWYPVNDISEMMQCAGCLTGIQPSIEAEFSYRLNELMARGENQGCVPVLLALLFLQNLSRSSFMFVPGMIVNKSKDIDIDIVASCDGHLILVECKDLRNFRDNDLGKNIYAQVLEVAEIAKDVGASIVFLATMLEVVPDSLIKRIDALNRRLNREIVVHILTFSDLKRGHKVKPHPSDPSKELDMGLNDFLPQKISKKSGWIKEPGNRRTSF